MIRLLDIFFALLGFVCLSWVFLCAIIGLLFTGEHKVFYRQKRVGIGGREFYVYKFATMLENSPNLPGGYLTRDNDPRILPFGNFLRRTKVNELPQLVNILKNDMSFVGPRPQAKVHFDLYEDHVKKAISELFPGVTGVAALFFRNEDIIMKNSGHSYEYFHDEVITPYKGELECWYAENQSAWLYLKIIYLTAATIINRNYNVLRFFKDLPIPSNELLRALPEFYRLYFESFSGVNNGVR
ncbi:MAG: sugar transferase [Pseudomonadales bacterium]|nr:sugar transferase [Pseudomonadales bacterium]